MSSKLNWNTYWHDAARSIKRAFLSRSQITLAGKTFRVAYEARNRKQTADYGLLRKAAHGTRCVFDVGANVGLTALVMGTSMARGGIVFAFEASEAACLVVRENALLNGLGGVVRPVNSVVAEQSAIVADFHWDFVSGRSSAVMEPPTGKSIPLKKACLSLDDFVFQIGAIPELIKIDVEGAEHRVVSGMTHLLVEHRPIVIVELHAWPGTTVGKNVGDILESVENADYQMIDVRSKRRIEGPQAYADVRQAANGVESRCRALMLPQDAEIPTWFKELDTSKL